MLLCKHHFVCFMAAFPDTPTKTAGELLLQHAGIQFGSAAGWHQGEGGIAPSWTALQQAAARKTAFCWKIYANSVWKRPDRGSSRQNSLVAKGVSRTSHQQLSRRAQSVARYVTRAQKLGSMSADTKLLLWSDASSK